MGERVLVVDDDQYTADSFARLISLYGYEVRAVYSGAEAVARGAEFLPDLALIDIGMPGMDGYETVRRIRQHRENPHVILVAVTGWAREEDRRRAYECGFDLHVAKPLSVEDLKDLLALLRCRRSTERVPCRHSA